MISQILTSALILLSSLTSYSNNKNNFNITSKIDDTNISLNDNVNYVDDITYPISISNISISSRLGILFQGK